MRIVWPIGRHWEWPSADLPGEAGAGRSWIAADDPIRVSTWSVEKSRQLLVRSLGMVV